MTDTMAGTTVLITGAIGFVGNYLVEECRRLGCIVHGTVRPGEADRLAQFGRDRSHLHEVELTDPAAVQALIEAVRPQQVYHLAAQASVQQAWRDPLATLANNSAAQFAVLNAVRLAVPEARVLVVSSSEVYGGSKADRMPLDEEEPLGPLDPYAVSKVTQEMLGLQHHLAFGLAVLRVRPFNHLGPRQRPGFVAADFARQIAEIEAGHAEPVIKVGNLSAIRDFSDVRDVVRAYTAVMRAGEVGAVYNVASGQGTSIADLLHTLIATATVPITVQVDPARLRPIDRPLIVGSAARLRTRTGWVPTFSLSRTIQETLDYWRTVVAGG